jgi:hypothetical protein
MRNLLDYTLFPAFLKNLSIGINKKGFESPQRPKFGAELYINSVFNLGFKYVGVQHHDRFF